MRYVQVIVGTMIGIISLLSSEEAAAEQEGFFTIGISLHKHQYYVGERLPVTTSIANNTAETLKFMQLGQLPGRCRYLLNRDGEEVLQRPANAPFGEQPLWAPGLIDSISPQRSRQWTREFIHLERGFAWQMDDPRGLAPGEYTLKVIFENTSQEFGLAVGRAESNEVPFTVKAWVPKREASKLSLHRDGWYGSETLVETSDGDVLATWGNLTLVVPLPFTFDIAAAKWWVDGDTIYIVVPEDAGRSERLIIVGPNCYKPTVVEPQESVVIQVE